MLVSVKNLYIRFTVKTGVVHAVNGVSFNLDEGKTLAIVGESGSGKTVTALALTKLLPPHAQIQCGAMTYRDRDLTALSGSALQAIRGREIAYIFQDPAGACNPLFTIGTHMMEVIKLHYPELSDFRARKEKACAFLHAVKLGDPEKNFNAYPHELSGGMLQRVMIAMALASRPSLLVADEPTTALDVTIQAHILDLLKRVRYELNSALLLITHDFRIISALVDTVAVMYRGRFVEYGPVAALLHAPKHPYTQALIRCIPKMNMSHNKLYSIPASSCAHEETYDGCVFASCCPHVMDACRHKTPARFTITDTHWVECWQYGV